MSNGKDNPAWASNFEKSADVVKAGDVKGFRKKSPGKLRITTEQDDKQHTKLIPIDHDSSLTINGRRVPCHSHDLEILELLGKGAYGVVHKMVHRSSGTIMAVKRVPLHLNTDKKKQTLMDLDVSMRSGLCPYAVKFFGAMVEEGEVWICMEMMDLSLDRLYNLAFSNHLKIEEDFHRKLAFCVVTALQFLKENLKVIHRDVKPSNILTNRHGEIKICDFGISGYLENSLAMTRIGCKFYMSPERIDPPDDCEGFGIKSDVWSFGITMIEIATGRYPYDQWKDPFHQIKQVVDGPAPVLPAGQFSDHFRSFVCDCLKKNVQERATYDQLLKHPFLTQSSAESINVSAFVKKIMELSAMQKAE